MSDIAGTLDGWVANLSEMTDSELANTLYLLERTYVHTLIERELRGAPR